MHMRKPATDEELEKIEVSDEEAAQFRNGILALSDHLARVGIPDVDLLYTLAIGRVAYLTGQSIGVPDGDLVRFLGHVAALFEMPNPNPPRLEMPRATLDTAAELNMRSKRIAFIVGPYQRKKRIHPTDMMGYLLNAFASRLSYYGMPSELITAIGADLLKESAELITRAGERLAGGAGAS
jgi:hypothetical protein